MEPKEFTEDLSKVQKLMSQEMYKDALILLEKLKKVEQQGNFNYNLTHKLYQLDSNARSLYNQQKILDLISEVSQNHKSILLTDLKTQLKEKEELDLDEPSLRREIEILILRELVFCKIEIDRLIF